MIRSISVPPVEEPDADVLAELKHLGCSTDITSEQANLLFGKLRKSQGSPRMANLVHGVQYLACQGDAIGARLLAAFLEISTPADRLLPRLVHFGAARRYFLRLQADERKANPFGKAWVSRLVELSQQVRKFDPGFAADEATPATRPGMEHPWQMIRSWVQRTLDEVRAGDRNPSPRLRLVRELLRLEIDALEERASHLAGIVDPFRVAGIQRLLPILSDIDSRIRDSRHLVACLESGNLGSVLDQSFSRALEVMDSAEYGKFLQHLQAIESAEELCAMLVAREKTALPAECLADDVQRLWSMGQRLESMGHSNTCSNLPGATRVAIAYGRNEGLQLPLGSDEVLIVQQILVGWQADGIDAGVELSPEGNALVLPRRTESAKDKIWEHGLPVGSDGPPQPDAAMPDPGPAPAAEETPDSKDGMGASEAKKLVMNSMQSTSILLSLLRNAKITSIPGLVAEVANRTRNPQIISTIAGDRTLYSGFANRDVPLACLRNPSNVSVKILRKFVHVKFVTKVDLKRLSLDKAGVRRELRREIDKYLDSLT